MTRLRIGDAAGFYPRGSTSRIEGKVIAIASTRARQLDWPVLADQYGGPISPTRKTELLAPNTPLFHVVIELQRPPTIARKVVGEVRISGARRRLLGSAGHWAASTLMRESGF